MDKSDTVSMNAFLRELSKEYAEDILILVSDNAPWHGSTDLQIPENILLVHIPPYTPEMNPIEQIWTEIRKRGFKNVFFASLDHVIAQLCQVIHPLDHATVSHITMRDWLNFTDVSKKE